MTSRSGLWWLLGATLVLTAWALWTPRAQGVIESVAPQPQTELTDMSIRMERQPNVQTKAGSSVALASFEGLEIEPARRDVFVPVSAPPPAVKIEPVVQEPLVAPPPPSAPPMRYRFLGRMFTPDGRPVVLLASGETSVEVQAGTVLEQGYVVQSVDGQAIRLLYPPLGTLVEIPIPPPPPHP